MVDSKYSMDKCKNKYWNSNEKSRNVKIRPFITRYVSD